MAPNKFTEQRYGGGTAEREREKTEWKNWSEIQMAAAGWDGWQDCVETLCATLHKEDR